MLSALEQEVIDKFHQLDKDARQRVRELIEREEVEAKRASFDYDAWFRDVEALREEIRASNGGVFPSIDVVGMLREIREGEDDE